MTNSTGDDAQARLDAQMASGVDWGHGHVFPRRDGSKARCGGPAICSKCALDAQRKAQQDEVARVARDVGRLSTADIIKFSPTLVGSGYRFDPDEILEAAKGQTFERLAILAQREDGSWYIAGNANAGETLILMERAKHQIVFGGQPDDAV